MKAKVILLFSGLSAGIILFNSCDQKTKTDRIETTETSEKKVSGEVALKDYGADPLVLNIEDYTSTNTNFRTTLWTGKNLQVTLMSIPVGGEVGLEQHTTIDQFLRIEEGEAQVLMGDSKEELSFKHEAKEDFAILVPAGKWHNIINTGNKPLKLYSIYSPPEHAHSTVHKTYEEAMEAELNH
ncbi:MAG: cupin domain-containing protein [Prevotella sp.]|jgi:mannose-6-phosphate isomerase-like protein (cupin superfamily)|nr:cupin domain-containing protein [Prevotella sp.]